MAVLSLRGIKLHLLVDVVFAVVLAVDYFIIYSSIGSLKPEFDALFFASYVFLILGAIGFCLLIASIKQALLIHMLIFPALSITYTFVGWIPNVMAKDILLLDSVSLAFKEATIMYIIVPLGFLLAHLNMYAYWMSKKPIFPLKVGMPLEENIFVNLALFAATILTAFIAGNLIFSSPLCAGLFSGSIVLMLGVHEFGHELAAYRHGVTTTLPYCLPAPTVLGTFGAFIRVKSSIPTRGARIEIGAVGPIAMFLVASTFALLGFMLLGSGPHQITVSSAPIAFIAPHFFLTGQVPSSLNLNPMVFAGWAMMLLTALNMMPVGELDGGHVAGGLLGKKRQGKIGKIPAIGLMVAGILSLEVLFLVWGFFILAVYREFPEGAADEISKPSRRAKLFAAVAFVILMLSLPIPLRIGWLG